MTAADHAPLATAIAATMGMVMSTVYVLYQRRQIQALREAVANERSKRITASDDDDTLALLEASAEVSPLARRLLTTAKFEVLENKVAAPPPADLSKHDLSAPVSPEQHWIIVRDDLLNEHTDEDRLKCLRRYVESGNKFTLFEGQEVAKLFTDPALRDEARSLIHPKREPSKKADFRWSRQAGLALCTLTCRCGKPGKEWKGAPGHKFKVTCGTCAMVEIDVVCSPDVIYVEPPGTGWVYAHGGKWIKADVG